MCTHHEKHDAQDMPVLVLGDDGKCLGDESYLHKNARAKCKRIFKRKKLAQKDSLHIVSFNSKFSDLKFCCCLLP